MNEDFPSEISGGDSGGGPHLFGFEDGVRGDGVGVGGGVACAADDDGGGGVACFAVGLGGARVLPPPRASADVRLLDAIILLVGANLGEITDEMQARSRTR